MVDPGFSLAESDDPGLWTRLDPGSVATGSIGFVWGNCQAESIRRMIAPVGADHGVAFVRLPPVFEMTGEQVRRLHALLPGAGVLVTQPVRDEYRVPGCGSQQLIAGLGPTARVVTVPTTYYEGLHPWQVHAHDGSGARVDAPLVDYHDLRLLDAAARGWGVQQALDRLEDHRPPEQAIREVAAGSRDELRRRNSPLDVDTTDAVLAGGAGAMWTVNHPSNAVLAALGRAVLSALGWPGEPAVPEHEMLGRVRTPMPPSVVEALGLSAGSVRRGWSLDGRPVTWEQVAVAAMERYTDEPEIARRAVTQHGARLRALGLR